MFRLALAVACAALIPATALAVAAPATAWTLAGDYAENQNPNGAWRYGQMVAGSFQDLAWDQAGSAYGQPFVGGFVYKRTAPGSDFGIGSGQVSLESDWGSAAVRWTAPQAGSYTVVIDVGGSLMSGPGGYGNNFALLSQVLVNGQQQSAASTVDAANGTFKLQSWHFTTALMAGDTVDTVVANPGFANGGNTQTLIAVTAAVPEPSVALLLAVGLAALVPLARQRPVPARA